MLKKKKVVVAFSGGKDSLALLQYMFDNKDECMWQLYPFHLNHGLRGAESDRDELFCSNWCYNNGLVFMSERVDVSTSIYAKDFGLQSAARSVRYERLYKYLDSIDGDYILTAHSADDQLESFFVDLITGASLYTISGIKAINGAVVRPILDVTIDMINEFLDHKGLIPTYDSSNSSDGYVRNRVHNNIVPAFGNDYVPVARTVSRLQKESDELYNWLSSRTSSCIFYEYSTIRVDRNVFDLFSIVEKKFLIGKLLSYVCRGGKLHSSIIMSIIDDGVDSRLNLPFKHVCDINRSCVRFFSSDLLDKSNVSKDPRENMVCCNNKTIIFGEQFDGVAVSIRNKKPGDRFNGVLLKKMFSDRKVERFLRDTALVFEVNGHIIHIEHLMNNNSNGISIKYKDILNEY